MSALVVMARIAFGEIVSVLYWAALVAGCYVLGAIALAMAAAAVWNWYDRWRDRRRRLRTPNRLVFDATARKCPWCDTHECLDRTQCTCPVPCGSWICEAQVVSRG